jgi:hypothetical protein
MQGMHGKKQQKQQKLRRIKRKMLLTEIKRLPADDYSGGKDFLYVEKIDVKKLKPLPGDSGMFYFVTKKGPWVQIYIVDMSEVNKAVERKGEPIVVGRLTIDKSEQYKSLDAYNIVSVTTNEDYRGKGYGLALYGIALTILKKTLIAGSSQTLDGRKMWLKLHSIPGVEVKGLVKLDKDEEDDSKLNAIMQLGGDMVGSSRFYNLFAFDVEPGNNELKPTIKNKLSQLYSNQFSWKGVLFAKWNGK